jgi:hypothetical protein
MIKLYSPSDEVQLALIESILEEDKIPYFIHNNHFGSLRVGPQIDILNQKTIMIDEEYEERAKELLADYFKTTEEETTEIPAYSLFDKLRMIFETLIFTWFVPGRHRKRINTKKGETEHINRGDRE